MSSDESSSLDSSNLKCHEDLQECILKCHEAKEFYTFPTKKVMRSVWLYKLGLDDDYYPNPTVCDRHFSEKMFDSNKKLKTNAVPDMNLPNELQKSTKDEFKRIAPVQLSSGKIRNVKKKPTKIVEIPSDQPKTSPPDTNSKPSQLNVITNTPPVANTSSTQNWLNDNSEILVDYQLKVQGKHLCDVIEIPQYIVVFTVVKANQKYIKLSDINKKRPPLKNLPKPSAFITIDDDDDIPETITESQTTATVQTETLEIEQPIVPAVQTEPLEIEQLNVLAAQTDPLEIEQPNVPAVEIQPSGNVAVQTEPLEIVERELPAVIPPKSPPIVKLKIKAEPEIDIVYYTTDEAPPRRDRAIQVNFPNKRKETAIQCDVQLDNDVREMSYNAESGIKMENTEINMDECLVCGEILRNYASKVRHVHAHEPSLCSQCGNVFDSKIKLYAHEKTVHSNNLVSWKPQRCPKMNCNKAFRSKKLLNNHIEDEHIKANYYQCNKCLQLFGTSMKLSCHQRALDKCLRTRGWTSRRWSKRT